MNFQDALAKDYWALFPYAWRLHGPFQAFRRQLHRVPISDLPEDSPLWTQLTEDDVVLEAGTNIGGLTRLLAARVKMVYTFEPNPKALDFARRNIGPVQNVSFTEAAISDRDGFASFNFGGDFNGGNSLYFPRESMRAGVEAVRYYRRLRVRTMTIGSFVRSTGVTFTVWVLDVEGAELSALIGGADFLPPKVFLETHKLIQLDGSMKHTRPWCEQFLTFNGYQVSSFVDRGGFIWLMGLKSA